MGKAERREYRRIGRERQSNRRQEK
jgi:hypothetical protein